MNQRQPKTQTASLNFNKFFWVELESSSDLRRPFVHFINPCAPYQWHGASPSQHQQHGGEVFALTHSENTIILLPFGCEIAVRTAVQHAAVIITDKRCTGAAPPPPVQCANDTLPLQPSCHWAILEFAKTPKARQQMWRLSESNLCSLPALLPLPAKNPDQGSGENKVD